MRLRLGEADNLSDQTVLSSDKKDSIAKTENGIMLPDKVQYLPETDMNMHIPAAKHNYVP